MPVPRPTAGRDPAATPPIRIGPVHFQSLEQELEPVLGYLAGHLLDAGCGTRDITGFLRDHGVTAITRYDLAPGDDDVVVGPLESMPFAGGTFDSVLCNAVLEHVADAEGASAELARVVRPGGHVVVAVPFLQPYHPCPGDFRRYTADGLAQLGRRRGLEVVAVLPVHCFAQTLGWMVWAYAQEKGGVLRKGGAWLAAYLATRRRYRTDAGLRASANTFQAVYRRPVPGERPPLGDWRAAPGAGEDADRLRLLHHLGEHYFCGLGSIVVAGPLLGRSALALAAGVGTNLVRRGYSAQRLIHWYGGAPPAHIGPYADLVEVHAGAAGATPWTGGPIEILIADDAPQWFPHLIPGRSVVVRAATTEAGDEPFEHLCDVGGAVAAYRWVGAASLTSLEPGADLGEIPIVEAGSAEVSGGVE